MVGILMGLYFVSLVAGVSSSSVYWVWVALEVGLLVVTYLSLMANSRVGSSFEYFLVQAVGSLVVMSGLLAELWGVALAGATIKMGLFPFMPWVYRVMWGMNKGVGVGLVLGLQKLIPLALMLEWGWLIQEGFGLFLGVLVLSAVLGGVGMLFGGGWVWVLTSSSVFHTSWTILMSVAGEVTVFTYFLGYMLVLASLVVVGGSERNGGSSLVEVMAVLASLPPMVGFGLKLYTFVSLVEGVGVVVMVLAVVSCVSLVGYLRGVNFTQMTSVLSGASAKHPTLPPTLSWVLGSVLMVAMV
uniref:NADH dehydrogenase subunit 2 n=1 Tax=Pomphorhynchus tereticollis TaxID=255491 RepID=A0A806GYR5_9BILA|nr:NADH dehydrogenase subunit 2 [Pomphorhynchus tereticollis]